MNYGYRDPDICIKTLQFNRSSPYIEVFTRSILLVHWARGKMIRRRSKVGSRFRKGWLMGLVPPSGLSINFFRLAKFVNLWHTVILFSRRLKRNKGCMTLFELLFLVIALRVFWLAHSNWARLNWTRLQLSLGWFFKFFFCHLSVQRWIIRRELRHRPELWTA